MENRSRAEFMKHGIENPAVKAFVAELGSELLVAQVLVRRVGTGYELRHAADAGAGAESLRGIELSEARGLAQQTEAGEFRPLKSAPTLRSGWRLCAKDDRELAEALDRLYPGALADWHAARAANPPVTNYREYTGRQSGMYRVTAKLSDAQAAGVIRSGCDRANCLKRRLWTVAGLAVDGASEKSLIPCLEPCAVLLELARTTARELGVNSP